MDKVLLNAPEVIKKSLQCSLQNKITFPEHMKTVASAGVISYEVDLRNSKVTYYLANNTTHTEVLPAINNQHNSYPFAKTEVKAAVKAIQQKARGNP